MSKPIGVHADGSNCYTKGCRKATNAVSRKEFMNLMAVSPARYSQPVPAGELGLVGLKYDYDYMECHGCSGCDSNEGPCRGRQYEGLRVKPSSIDVKGILSSMLTCSPSDITDELEKIGLSVGLTDGDEYDIRTVGDYYGDVVEGIYMYPGTEKMLLDKLNTWYQAQNK